ncbi:MAG: methyl-accepting chemotaxis protein, partial [Gemmatimonadales bacterium]
IWILTAGLLLLVFLAAFIGYGALRSVGQSADAELETLARESDLESGLVASILGEIRSAQQYLIAPSPRLKLQFIAYGDSAYRFQRRFRELPSLSGADRLILNRIEDRQAEIEVAYSLAHALADVGRRPDALAQAQAAEAPADSLVSTVRTFTRARANASLDRARALRQDATRQQMILFGLLGLAVIVGLAFSWKTITSVSVPLKRLVGAAERFGAGDLRPVQLGDMPTELDQLAMTLDSTGARLRKVVSEVITEAEQISTSAGEFSAMSQELAASGNEISTQMVKVSTSSEGQVKDMALADNLISHLRQTSVMNAEATNEMVRVGDGIRQVATQHHTDVDAARRTLLDVREVVQTSAAQVRELTQLSTSITAFIDLIKQISSQTNLLALNAAIEAARAGEQGRGFAVVAEEVRHLADSSARAAEDVTRSVQELLNQVRDISATMEVGNEKVGGIEHVAQAAARGLEEISTAVQQIQDAAARVKEEASRNKAVVDELATATGQAAAAATQHAASSESVSAAVEEQNAATEEMAAAASELMQGANRLTWLVSDFQT